MASLDDFFAKKDKSKKKSKSKYATVDGILSSKEEEPKKTTEKKKKEPKEKPQQQGDGTGETRVEDEEWKDFEQEAETDYSGLRIQTLQIGKEEENEEKEEEEEVDEDGEVIERKDTSAGPWAAMQASKPAPPPPEPVKQVVEEPAPKPSGKYVPPGARAAAMAPQPLVQRRGKKTAPNLTSEEDFPTLGIQADREREAAQLYMSQGSQFEQVRSGGRQSEDPTMRTPQLTLGNKFEALQRE